MRDIHLPRMKQTSPLNLLQTGYQLGPTYPNTVVSLHSVTDVTKLRTSATFSVVRKTEHIQMNTSPTWRPPSPSTTLIQSYNRQSYMVCADIPTYPAHILSSHTCSFALIHRPNMDGTFSVAVYYYRNGIRHQQQHINQLPKKPKFHHLAGDTWNRHISTALIRNAHKLWTSRCTEVHKGTADTQYTKDQEETIAQLYRFYDKVAQLNPTHRKIIFSQPIETHIKHGQRHIKNWIRRNAKTVKKFIAIQQKQTQRQPSILQFFHPKHTKHKTHNDLQSFHPSHTKHKPYQDTNSTTTQSELTTLESGC